MRKEIKKRERGQALLGRPASLSAQPGSAARFPSPLSPARGARLAPTGAGHVAAVRQRRGHAAADPPSPGRDANPRPQATPFCPHSSLSSSSARERNRSRSSSAAAPSPEKLRCSPPVTPVAYPQRQSHHCTRRRRGKLLRTLYRGERPSFAVNRSPELLRPRRRAPPRRTSLVSASFRLLFGTLGP